MTAATRAPDAERLDLLERKIDGLSEQLAELTMYARDAEASRRERQELFQDLSPVAGEAFELASRELEEIQPYVEAEDLVRLGKRLLISTRMLESSLEQLESLGDLVQDAAPLGREVLGTLTDRLDEYERKGYFAFARGGGEVLARVVSSFGEDDIHALGDNIVLILDTVKEMTQPEIMNMLQRTAGVVREDVDHPPAAKPPSLLQLLRRMNSPAVKQGLARFIHILEGMSQATPARAPATRKERQQ